MKRADSRSTRAWTPDSGNQVLWEWGSDFPCVEPWGLGSDRYHNVIIRGWLILPWSVSMPLIPRSLPQSASRRMIRVRHTVFLPAYLLLLFPCLNWLESWSFLPASQSIRMQMCKDARPTVCPVPDLLALGRQRSWGSSPSSCMDPESHARQGMALAALLLWEAPCTARKLSETP